MSANYTPSRWTLLSGAIGLWIILVFTIACSPNLEGLWRKAPPNASVFFKDNLPGDQFGEVKAAMQNMAKESLLNVGFVEISADLAAMYGQEIRDSGGHFYLIRGLRCTESGGFSIYRHGTEIYASHVDLGSSVTLRNTALVVWLKDPLTNVFSNCSVAD